MRNPWKKHLVFYSFLVVWLLSWAVHLTIMTRDVAGLERACGAPFAPFLVESAMMYDCINRFAAGESIGGVDAALPAMKHRTAAEQMSLSLEYAGGWLLRGVRCFTDAPEAGEYEPSAREALILRVALAGWTALLPALIGLILLALRVPWYLAIPAALVDAFSPAALGRYTGQDLIKGAFALPLLAAWLWFCVWQCRRNGSRRVVAGVAVTAGLAVASWDAAQIFIGALALTELLRLLGGGAGSVKRRNVWLATEIALLAAGLFLPYHQAHGFLFSPVVQWLLPTVIAVNAMGAAARWRRPWRALLATGVFGVWWWGLGVFSEFGANYSHFGKLLAAKVRFLNVKPGNPELLDFDARFLWTPELHSATWGLTRLIFPAALWVTVFLAAGYLLYRLLTLKKAHYAHGLVGAAWQYGVLAAGFFVTYVLMVRFRDMTLVFVALSLGVLAALWWREARHWRGFWRRAGVLVTVLVLLATAGAEWWRSTQLKRRYPDDMAATAQLVRYLRTCDLRGVTLLADMQLSPLLKAYCGTAVLVQPKYELPEVRGVMQEYLETFFNGSEEEFGQFCADRQVAYVVVHLPMVLTPSSDVYSYRYMTATHELRLASAPWRMLCRPDLLTLFAEVELPEGLRGSYRIYQVASPESRREAGRLHERALSGYYSGRRQAASRLIRAAQKLAPADPLVRESYVRILNAAPPAPKLPGMVEKTK